MLHPLCLHNVLVIYQRIFNLCYIAFGGNYIGMITAIIAKPETKLVKLLSFTCEIKNALGARITGFDGSEELTLFSTFQLYSRNAK